MNGPMHIIEEGRVGPVLVLTGPWGPDAEAMMKDNRLFGLMINYARGWSGDDIDFVKELPFLRELIIIDWNIDNVSPVEYLHELRAIQISTYCKTPLDFSNFPHLEDCGLRWRKGADSVFERDSLRRLFLSAYDGEHSAPFSGLRRLSSLAIAEGKLTEIESLASLVDLAFVGLYHLPRLQSLHGVETSKKLVDLEVEDCKNIHDLSPLHGLTNLKRLILSDCRDIASIQPLKELHQLSELIFAGSTSVEDGDMSILLNLPALSRVAYKNRKHYQPPAGVIQQHLVAHQ